MPVRFLIALVAWLILIEPVSAGERLQCNAEPVGAGYYRTKVDGHAERCYYDGPRMKDRDELFWPAPPMQVSPADKPTWDMIERWRGEYQRGGASPGWQHKE